MKMWILGAIGVSAGFTTASALFALIVTIGVISRLAQMTHTARYIHWYERCFMMGCTVGNTVYLFELSLKWIPSPGIAIIGLFMGIYLGCFIGALAEVLQLFPFMFKRLHLKTGTKWFLIGISGGKMMGALLDFFV